MALAVAFDNVSRLVFNRPFNGMIEYQTFTLVTVIFLALSHTFIKEGHVSVDIISTKFSDKLKFFLRTIFSIWATVLFGFISWQAGVRTVDAFSRGDAAQISELPMYPFYAMAALGFSLMSIVGISNFFESLGKVLRLFKSPLTTITGIVIISIGFLAVPGMLQTFSINVSPEVAGIIAITTLMIIMLLGFPIGFGMALVGFLGLWYLMSFDLALQIVQIKTYNSVAHYYYCVVPFFLLMGFLALEAGVGARLFKTANLWLGRLPGGMGIATICGCGGFAAICGESMATAATMGSVALPEMRKHNYDESLSTGALAAGGTLGILIPPSIGFVVYGIVTEQSIGKLFMAGIMPGILLMLAFGTYMFVRCTLNPSLAPRQKPEKFSVMLASLKNVWEAIFIFTVVIGGIYSGILTPTEAGGIGALGALVMALLSKEFNRKKFFAAVSTATQMTAMIYLIIIGVMILGHFISMSNIPIAFAEYISSLVVSRWVVFAIILAMYLFLGMIMNIIPMMMLTLPILFPTVKALGFDPIWFGVIMVIMMEMGQITPPIGVNVFVIYGVAKDIPMTKIFMGIMPFILIKALVIVILAIFPDIALYLPNVMEVLHSISVE
jgi:tripartite ATP-independent transporter DctM subunit